MAGISAAMVKQLRESTGVGMMDCKKALTETQGDLDAAVDWLRKKGLAAAAKKAGRVAAEGLVGVVTEANRGALLEVNAETDFVARNDEFQRFVKQAAGLALAAEGDLAATAKMAYPQAGHSVGEQLTQLIAKIGENMALRRAGYLAVETGVVSAYVHNQISSGLGKIGVIVAIESTGDPAALAALGKQLAMHVAAAAPQALETSELDPAVLERERSVLSEQARASGKPESIIEKMVEGRMRKFYAEAVMMEQVFVIDGEQKVRTAVEAASKALGAPIKVTGFKRFLLGEGIERGTADFAAEVAAQLGS